MQYVYILRSLTESERHYVGTTADLKARLAKHNAGEVSHTWKHVPWQIRTYMAFDDKAQAFAFEKYLDGLRSSLCEEASIAFTAAMN